MLGPISVTVLQEQFESNKQGFPDIFQKTVLNALHFTKPYSTHADKAKIAEIIGVDLTTVKSWFQHHCTSKEISTLIKPTHMNPG